MHILTQVPSMHGDCCSWILAQMNDKETDLTHPTPGTDNSKKTGERAQRDCCFNVNCQHVALNAGF